MTDPAPPASDPVPAPDPQPTDVPFSSIEAVDNAEVYQWSNEDPAGRVSIFPRHRDLPDEIVTATGGVDLGSMIGVLWGGMRQLYERHYTVSAKVTAQAKQIATLQSQVAALRAAVDAQQNPPAASG